MANSADPSGPGRGVDWRPPRQGDSNVASMVVGAILLLIGIWYLLDQTLGFRMPRIDWGAFWPVVLIAVGGVMLYRSAKSRT
jgi:uncharacterized membrane protein HdeD (DUF308 family)